MTDLTIIIPSRNRPESVARTAEALAATDTFTDRLAVNVVYGLHHADPNLPAYREAIAEHFDERELHGYVLVDGEGMVPSVNTVARALVKGEADFAGNTWPDPAPFAIAVLGDDHLPRTVDWAAKYVAALAELGTGIVYGDDLLRGEKLPTQWAMTSDIVAAINRCVPALVGHLYCDDAILSLGTAAGCIRYLPDVVVEHIHPVAGKAEWDEGYRWANSWTRKQSDRSTFQRWLQSEKRARQVAAVAELVTAHAAKPAPATGGIITAGQIHVVGEDGPPPLVVPGPVAAPAAPKKAAKRAPRKAATGLTTAGRGSGTAKPRAVK